MGFIHSNFGVRAVLFFVLLFFSQCQKREKKQPLNSLPDEEAAATTNELPSMPVTFIDGHVTNVQQLEGNLIIVFFLPDCDLCQHEATKIREELDAFKNYSLYFLSSAPLNELKKFKADYALQDASIHFGQTTVESILSNFGSIPAPSVYVYSAEKKLIKRLNGEIDMEELIRSL